MAASKELQNLRRWCVEQAVKWPQVGYSSGMSYGGGYSDADIVGRAKQLEAYVTGKPVKE